MKIVNDDGSPVTPEQEVAYFRARERAWMISRAASGMGGAFSWLWTAAKSLTPNIITAVLTAVLVLFLGGHLVLPTGGCSWPIPTPTPPKPPAPTDPLTKTLQAAYDADTDPQKANALAALTSLYGNVIAQARASGSVTTLKQLQTSARAAENSAISLATNGGKMPNLQEAVSHYVAGKMPAQDGPMTDALWLDATTAYGDVAKALKGVH